MGKFRINEENGKVCVQNGEWSYWFEDETRERTMFFHDFKESLRRDGEFTFTTGESFSVTVYRKRNIIVGYDRHGEVFVDVANSGFNKIERSWSDAGVTVLSCYYGQRISEMNGGPISYGDGYISFTDWLAYEFSTNGCFGTPAWDEKWKPVGMLLPFPEELWQIYRVQLMARYNLRELPYP